MSAQDVSEVKAAFWQLFDEVEASPGEPAVGAVKARIGAFCLRYRTRYPEAVRCLEEDQQALLSHLRFPREHWRRIRHSNFIERTFGETRRRVKVIGRLPGERSCVSLVWAVLERASRGWRGLTQSAAGIRLLQDLRRQLIDPPTGEEKEVVPAAA